MKKLFLIFCSVLFACTTFLFACNGDGETTDDKQSNTTYEDTEDDKDAYESWEDDEWADRADVTIEDSSMQHGGILS